MKRKIISKCQQILFNDFAELFKMVKWHKMEQNLHYCCVRILRKCNGIFRKIDAIVIAKGQIYIAKCKLHE